MCDTFIINNNNKRYFLKNSDRSPNEPNLLEYVPRMTHDEETLKCTYISIPQVKETYEMILVKPSWIWGAEMGFNEYGVSIGNEAVFTKTKSKEESLIGMDYLRLGLERSKSAKEALDTIINLLKIYSQGGNCGFDHEFYYNNSYLIADKNECYCLETVGKDYAYKKIEGSYNISNKLSLSKDYDEASKEYIKGFKETNSDFIFTFGSKSRNRECKGRELLNIEPTLNNMIKILSNHRKGGADIKGDVGSICMHKTALGDHTTASMIVDYNNEIPTVWLSSGMSPCLAIFKPYYLGKTSFVRFEESDRYKYTMDRMMLNRLVLSEYVDKDEYKEMKEKFQNKIILKEKELRENNANLDSLNDLSRESDNIEERLISLYKDKIDDLRNGKIRLFGIWDKLTIRLSKDPFSRNLISRKQYK